MKSKIIIVALLLGLFGIICIVYAQTQPIAPLILRFLDLTDVDETTYTGEAGKFVKVNAGETAIEFGTPAGAGDLLADGSVPLTANWDVGAFTITALKFTSDQATGTAPFTVASTTEVANLRAATATVGTNVTITDNENTAENNPVVFVENGDLDGGNLGLESDGDFHYNPSTGTVTATVFSEGGTGIYNITESDAAYQPLEATLTDIADGTINENLDNTTNPWAVNEGGTGAATFVDGGILVGAGTGAITELPVLGNGVMIIGDGVTDPVLLAAFTSSVGYLKHQRGGLEADISAIADGGILVGTGAGTMAIRATFLTGGAAGFIKHELGGLEADINAYTGLVAITGGATAEVDSKSELEGHIADVADFAEADGDTWTGTHYFSGATVTMPKRTKNDDRYFTFNAFNPNSLYDTDTQICFEPNLPAAITITEVTVSCDADPATELDWDLKFADAFIGLANATLIVAIDTTSGTTDVDSGFNDSTVPAGKCLYVEFAADPNSNIKQAIVKIRYDYD